MDAWERFLSTLEMEIGKETVDKWLRTLKIIDFDACNLYLEAEDAFQLSWFEEQVRSRIQKSFVNNNHKPVRVHLTIASVSSTLKKKGKGEQLPLSPPSIKFTQDGLDPHATFDQFVPGTANQVIYKLLLSLAEGTEKPGAFNPVYIHGPSCSGKSHLLMAATHLLQRRGISALYVRAETFTEHVVAAIRGGVMREFREAYRHAEVLLVDDIPVFAKKSATQEEFFHTFNTLHTSGRQIILSGDRSPQAIEEIEPRLISRFEWGIILPLQPLASEEMKTMLRLRCTTLDFPLSEAVIDFLVHHFTSNAKAVHRALEALILRAHMGKHKTPSEQLSIEGVSFILADLLNAEKETALTTEKLVHATAEVFGIRVDEILGKSQSQECVVPRQIGMYLCRMELKIPFLKIGSLFGRDHSTVMTSVKQIQKRLETGDKELRYSIADILQKAHR